MKDQKEFLHQMEELVDFGRTKDSTLTMEEVRDYCSDMNLTKEQIELVYAYLDDHLIHVPGYSKAKENAGEVKLTSEDSKYLAMYKKELCELEKYTEEEIDVLYERLRGGEEEVISAVVESHLQHVVSMAGKYKNRGIPLEDLIQEGNLELMTCVSMLCGNTEVEDFKKTVNQAVKTRLMELVDEELENGDHENSVVAKTNLLLEATNVLAKEFGRVATIEELSEFTHMDIEEIQMYVDLSREKIELGQGEKN